MAQKRMFSKSVVNSSIFLKMPATSRLLYYDLGMNADDDGFVEHFMVLRMTGATQQDLGVLELNGLIKIFDDNVLWIKDWKENNYIPKDRYKPSKYLAIYDLNTLCIQNVYSDKIRLDKISIDKKYIVEQIIAYLNEKCGTKYKSSTNKTKSLINARLNEGFTLDDLKKVVDIKTSEWLNTKMEQYLRPETLFGTKFESYLNQKHKESYEEMMARLRKEVENE